MQSSNNLTKFSDGCLQWLNEADAIFALVLLVLHKHYILPYVLSDYWIDYGHSAFVMFFLSGGNMLNCFCLPSVPYGWVHVSSTKVNRPLASFSHCKRSSNDCTLWTLHLSLINGRGVSCQDNFCTDPWLQLLLQTLPWLICLHTLMSKYSYWLLLVPYSKLEQEFIHHLD